MNNSFTLHQLISGYDGGEAGGRGDAHRAAVERGRHQERQVHEPDKTGKSGGAIYIVTLSVNAEYS